MHAIPMMAVTVVTSICFTILATVLAVLFVYLIRARREKRIAFLKSYKYGKFAIIYIIAIPLYLVGHMYLQSELDFFNALFSAIDKSAALVVLMYKTESIAGIVNTWYWVNIYFTFTLVAINATLFALSLTSQYLWQFFQRLFIKCSKKQKLFIFGYNQNSVKIFNSRNGLVGAIVDNMSKEDAEQLYIQNVPYITVKDDNAVVKGILKSVKQKLIPCIIVINTKNDKKNIRLCRQIIEELNDLPDKDRIFGVLKVYTFGNPGYEQIYEDLVKNGYGCIHFVNTYRKIAINFIDKYPFTRFMDERQIDYNSSLVKDGVEVNVCMLGFGKINRQLFLTSIANNQFLKRGDGVELKLVNYYLFDKNEECNFGKSFNHNYYRFDTECGSANPQDYLPLPSRPANEKYIQMDINDKELYPRIRNIFSGKNDANFMFIAFGSELENIDMAQKLIAKRDELGVNFTIFVKAKSLDKNEVFSADSNCYFIGNYDDEIYNLDEIVSDKIFTMAQQRAELYSLENEIAKERKKDSKFVITQEWIEKIRTQSLKKWFKDSQIKRESNLYCCLNLKFKLNLMGLDYCKNEEEGVALTEEEYLNIYADGDLPDTSDSNETETHRKIVRYDINFKDSRRRTMAIHEHYRWNSFYISKGFVPATKEQIENEKIDGEFTNGKVESIRRHGCLTTFDGLIEYRRLLAARSGNIKDEDKFDVIKYDYQLLDDAWWLLNETGYKIVKKQMIK